MKFYAAKLLEIIGMMVVLSGLVLGLQNDQLIRFELAAMVAGSAIFILGWYLEKN